MVRGRYGRRTGRKARGKLLEIWLRSWERRHGALEAGPGIFILPSYTFSRPPLLRWTVRFILALPMKFKGARFLSPGSDQIAALPKISSFPLILTDSSAVRAEPKGNTSLRTATR